MKKQPTISTKGTNKKNELETTISSNYKHEFVETKLHAPDRIYKTAPYSECESELLKIVKAHYVYSGYIMAFGNFFTTGPEKLRPELNIDFGNLLARCFGIPSEGKKISKILADNYPSFMNLDESVKVALNSIYSYCNSRNMGKTRDLEFTGETLKELIHVGCIIDQLTWGIGQIQLFGDKSTAFDYNGTTDNSFYSYVHDVSGYILDLSPDIVAHYGSLYSFSNEAEPFKSTDFSADLDYGINYILKVVSAFPNKAA